ncbi:MAG: AfsR/SARP family transcriptional regulator [Gemmatimonadales bacterium]
MLRLITLGRLQLLRDGPPSESLHLQPKRLALLAYLALTTRDGWQQRDSVLALFWPRADRTRARRCLRQALFHLRNELGDGVILNRGRDGIALAPDRLWCDAAALERALRAKRARDALELHRGDFLPGLFVDRDSGELDEWVDRTRQRLRAAVVAAAWDLADADADAGRLTLALEVAFRARILAPDDERGLRRHAALLARAGDAAAALGACAAFSRRLRREYDAAPSPETVALAQVLREGRPPTAGI